MRLRRGGLSLLEVLFTAALIGVALGVVGLVTRQFNRAMSHSEANDLGLEGILALRRMAAEVEQATSIGSPGVNANSTVLRFSRLDPSFPDRIPPTLLPTPHPIPGGWEPRDPAYLVTVSFALRAGQQLFRKVDFANGTFEDHVFATGMVDFRVSHPRRGELQLQATVARAQGSRTVHLPVLLKAVPSELTP